MQVTMTKSKIGEKLNNCPKMSQIKILPIHSQKLKGQ